MVLKSSISSSLYLWNSLLITCWKLELLLRIYKQWPWLTVWDKFELIFVGPKVKQIFTCLHSKVCSTAAMHFYANNLFFCPKPFSVHSTSMDCNFIWTFHLSIDLKYYCCGIWYKSCWYAVCYIYAWCIFTSATGELSDNTKFRYEWRAMSSVPDFSRPNSTCRPLQDEQCQQITILCLTGSHHCCADFTLFKVKKISVKCIAMYWLKKRKSKFTYSLHFVISGIISKKEKVPKCIHHILQKL